MADRLSFQLDLTGTMATALAPVNAQLAVLVPGLDSVKDKMAGLPTLVFDVGRAFEWAAGAMMKAAGALADFGRFLLKTAVEKQDLDLALRFNAGREGAAGLQAMADSFSNTKFDDGEILAAQIPLLQVGIKNQELLHNLTTAATDLEALSAGQVKFAEVLDSFSKAARKGEINDRVLAPLKIGSADYFSALGEALGVDAKRAEELNKAGKVQAEDSLQVLLGIIQEREGGSIGGPSLEAGKTLGATLHRLENLPGNMFKVLSDSPAIQGVQAAIEGFIASMQGPQGVALVAKIGEGLNKVFGWLTEGDVSARIDGLIERVSSFLEVLDAGLAIAGLVKDAFVAVGDTLGMAAAGWYMLYEDLAEVWDKVLAWRDRVVAGAIEIGSAIIDGVVSGITGAMGRLSDAVTGVSDNVVTWFKDKLGIHSPSEVFRGLGAMTGEGFALGLEDSGDRVTGATRALLARDPATSFALRPGAPGAGGASVSNRFEFNIQGSNAGDIADEVMRRVELALAQHYDRAALELGGAPVGAG